MAIKNSFEFNQELLEEDNHESNTFLSLLEYDLITSFLPNNWINNLYNLKYFQNWKKENNHKSRFIESIIFTIFVLYFIEYNNILFYKIGV